MLSDLHTLKWNGHALFKNLTFFLVNLQNQLRMVSTRRCPFFEKYFFEKFKNSNRFFKKFRKISKKIEKNSTTQFVLSNHCFWFKTSIIAL
jgi:hypothetical protein